MLLLSYQESSFGVQLGLTSIVTLQSAQKIIQSILDNPEEKPDIEQLVHKRMKDNVQDLEIAIEGNLTPEQVEKLRVIKAHYDALAICKEDLEQMIPPTGAAVSRTCSTDSNGARI